MAKLRGAGRAGLTIPTAGLGAGWRDDLFLRRAVEVLIFFVEC